MSHSESWTNLEAYLDGELPAETRWAVAAHLSDCAECRQQLAALARMREITRGHLAAVELPLGLQDRLRAALAAEPDPAPRPRSISWSFPSILRLAAVLAILAVGIALLAREFAPIASAPASLRAEVTLAHALFAQDTSKLDVVGDASDVNAWFRDKAGFTVSIPQFAGFSLAGARLIVLDGQAVAQLVYRRDSDGAYLSVLRFQDRGVDLSGLEPVDGYLASQQGATSLITWTKSGERTVMIGEVSPPTLRVLAADLASRPDSAPAATDTSGGTPHPGRYQSRYDTDTN
jgi:anti-sigma factor RsiW